MIKKLFLFVLTFALLGCVMPEEGTKNDGDYVCITSSVCRVIDVNADVVCYVYRGYEKGGISCLPLSESSLDY